MKSIKPIAAATAITTGLGLAGLGAASVAEAFPGPAGPLPDYHWCPGEGGTRAGVSTGTGAAATTTALTTATPATRATGTGPAAGNRAAGCPRPEPRLKPRPRLVSRRLRGKLVAVLEELHKGAPRRRGGLAVVRAMTEKGGT